jgi:hypothetical protein
LAREQGLLRGAIRRPVTLRRADARVDIIRRTRGGDIITNGHTHSSKPWFHFPVGTPVERITVATAPVISVDEQRRLRLIRKEQRR